MSPRNPLVIRSALLRPSAYSPVARTPTSSARTPTRNARWASISTVASFRGARRLGGRRASGRYAVGAVQLPSSGPRHAATLISALAIYGAQLRGQSLAVGPDRLQSFQTWIINRGWAARPGVCPLGGWRVAISRGCCPAFISVKSRQVPQVALSRAKSRSPTRPRVGAGLAFTVPSASSASAAPRILPASILAAV